MAVMSMGSLSKVEAVVEEDTSVVELPAEETRVFMNRVEEGAEIGVKRRRKPPPYMIKLFKDHTR